MKPLMTTIALTGLLGSMLSLVAVAQDDTSVRVPKAKVGCSAATLQGPYAFFRTGWEPAGPMVAVGIVTFDGKGGSKFRQTIRVNGVTTSSVFAGAVISNYEVASNCSVRLVDPTGFVFGHAVITAGGSEAYLLSLTGTNTIYGIMKKMD